MATIRISNIEAKADAGSPSIDERVTFKRSTGENGVVIDAKQVGITSVGINTDNPQATLHVVGDIVADNFVGSIGLGATINLDSIGIGTTIPRVSLDIAEKTDAIALPQGTTAQRPTGNNAYIRYNTTNSALEFYNGTDWVEIISDYFPTGSVILG